MLSGGDVFEGGSICILFSFPASRSLLAVLHATVSASFTIEQLGLPNINEPLSDDGGNTRCNDDDSFRRLDQLRARLREREI